MTREQSSRLIDFSATLDCHVVPPRNDARRGKVTDSVRLFLLSSHATTLRLASLRGGTTWQSSVAENLLTDSSSSHCAKGMYSKLGVPTRRSRELKTKFCSKPVGKFILLRPARRKVGQVLNEALTFFVSIFVSRQKMKIKGVACDSLNTNLVPNKYSESPLHMTKVEPNKLYPNTCVRTYRLKRDGIGTEFFIRKFNIYKTY